MPTSTRTRTTQQTRPSSGGQYAAFEANIPQDLLRTLREELAEHTIDAIPAWVWRMDVWPPGVGDPKTFAAGYKAWLEAEERGPEGLPQTKVEAPTSRTTEGDLPRDLAAVLPWPPTSTEKAFLQLAYVEFVTRLKRGPTKQEVECALARLKEGEREAALRDVEGWVDALQELTRATTPFRILDADVIAGLRDRVATLPEALQGAWYTTLHAAAEYDSQRDNDISAEGPGGGTCNITSVAMALRGMGVDVSAEDLYAGLPESQKGQLTGSGMRASVEAATKGAMTTWLFRGAPLAEPDFWTEQVGGLMAAGKGVFLGVNGHVVRLQEVRDDALVVDDPYAKESIDDAGNRHIDAYNRRGDQQDRLVDAGADSVWTFEEWLGKAEGPQWVRFIANNPLDAALGKVPEEKGGEVTGGLLDGFELRRD